MTTTPPTGRSSGGPGAGPPAWRPAARRAMLWSSAAGLLLALAGALVAWTWRDELPAQVASHWSGAGAPDGFSSVGSFLLVGILLAVGLCAVFAAIGWAWGAVASTRRLAAGGCVWSGAFAAAVLLTSLAPQRGLADASEATDPGWALALSLLLPLVPAGLAAALVPGDRRFPSDAPVAAGAARAVLHDGERAAWSRRAAGGPGLAAAGVTILVTTALAVVLETWAMLVVPVLLAGLFAAMFAFTVRVDATGLTVRSVLGWPGTHVPADEVVVASVTEVSPFAEFGGWGWRAGPGGRVGVVLRRGESLLVERTGGRSLVVTVDDAASAAALLNTLADRARAAG
ncbi:DUF1648 domain-containing protein [Isoptericola cucumis]|uniref:DUF1648 domain-containing protein n=1 Tax=Isoptericola cucumis TaxID=1776856 RepID=UPI0032091E9E